MVGVPYGRSAIWQAYHMVWIPYGPCALGSWHHMVNPPSGIAPCGERASLLRRIEPSRDAGGHITRSPCCCTPTKDAGGDIQHPLHRAVQPLGIVAVCCQQDMARCPWFFPTRLVPHRTPRATRGATQAPPKFERRGRPALLGIRAAFPPLWERWRAAHPTGGWVLHTTPSDVCPGLRRGWSLAGFSSRPPRLILVALIHVPDAVSNA
jgi:hypothetical protein